MPTQRNSKRWFAIGLAITGLFLVYVYQHFDYLNGLARLAGLGVSSASASFAFNRMIRLVLNDMFCLAIINEWFREPKFLRVALYVFLVELIVLLPIYLLIKLNIEGPTEISSPLLQPIHRMIVNPLLMFILIGSFYYQQWRTRST